MKKNSKVQGGKRNYLLFSAIILIMSVLPFLDSFGQNYDVLWNKVKELQGKDMPRKVIDEAQEIYDKASKEKNFPQIAKSWITIVETKSNLDPDSFRIADLPPFPHQGPVEDAVYNALMGSAYNAMKDSYISDFDEETQAEYTQKAKEHFALSLRDKKALAEASALEYEPLIEEGADSRLYRHDMLSLLTRFALDHAEMDYEEQMSLLAGVTDYYKENGPQDAYALTRLEQLRRKRNYGNYYERLSFGDYQNALKGLVDETKDIDAGADVAMAYCETLAQKDDKLAFARWARKQYAKAYCVNYFANVENELMHGRCSLSIPSDILPNKPFGITLDYENLTETKLEIRLYNGIDKNHQFRTDGKLIDTRSYVLANDSANVARRAQNLPTEGKCEDTISLAPGHYVCIVRTPEKVEVNDLEITSLRLVLFEMPNKDILAIVYDIVTGRPVPNATVVVGGRNEKDKKKYPCDSKGEVIIPNSENRSYYSACIEGTDDKTGTTYLYNRYRGNEEGLEFKCQLFTDRAIYRPGHTVHVSGLVYSQLEDQTQVAPDRPYTLTLRDANGKEVQKAEVTTNPYGSYDCQFVIPTDRLPGIYTVSDNDHHSIDFRVEEYKRPTFDVNARAADTGGREIKIGDTIQVEALAQTYSGVPVQGAKVKYTIETSKVSFWFWGNRGWESLTQGEGITGDDGKLSVPLFLDPMKLDEGDDDQVLRYRVTFDVTDMAGETQTCSYSTSVSLQEFSLNISCPNPYDVSSDQQVVINACNANHEPVKVSGEYMLYLSDSDTEVCRGVFTAAEPIQLPKLTPGAYSIIATAKASNGKVITSRESRYDYYSIFNSETAIPLSKTGKEEAQKDITRFRDDFFYVKQKEFSLQQPAEILFSPSEKDVLVSYMLLSKDQLVKRSSFVLGRELYRLTIPYDESYGDGLRLFVWYVRNGKICTESTELTYVRPDKSLKLTWSTFRDRLYPGQDEEWILTIHDKDGKPMGGAELLATMYDASLDAFDSHSLPFSLAFARFIPYYQQSSSNSNYGVTINASRSLRQAHYRKRSFDNLTEFIHERWLRPRRVMVRGLGAAKASFATANATMDLAEEMVVTEQAMAYDAMPEDLMGDEEAILESAQLEETAPAPQLRSNFAETAFFYPHLLSDANGDVRISFTLPESLTQWKFLGLAHDKDVNYGRILATAVAQKNFMVQPNMPRFVREGDKTRLVARIINQDQQDLNGTARLRLLDAETEQVVYTASLPFAVEQGKTTSVAFDVEIDDRYPMLICEMSGVCGEFSDGERNYLPVLTSKKYITEAIPFYVTRDDNVKDIDVSSLFNEGSQTATHKRLLFEYTARPEWTIIEALDGIKLPTSDCSICYGASLYANTMASRIAQGIPGFADAVRAAQAAGIKATSQLDENEGLRDIVLKESPWVNEALQEAEQRERLIDLFNETLMNSRIAKAKEKLQKMQLSDGSWTWFEGMNGSYYITLSICENLAMLESDDADVKSMLEKGLTYLDADELDRYETCVRKKLPIHASNPTLQYLYISSLVPEHNVDKKVKKMREAYLKDIESNVRDLTIHGRAVAACVLRTFGHTRSADDFLESAVEYTISKPGMGRYYATDQAYYSWRDYRIPTQLAAMRAIRQSSRSDKKDLLNEMQIWLLRQKQTQTWDNEMNTIAAVNFLLHNGNANGEEVTAAASGTGRTFSLSSEVIPTPIDTSRFLSEQLGYVRTQVDNKFTKQPLQKLTVTASGTDAKQLPTISWGALYAQYLEEMDQLKDQSTGEMKVTVKFYRDGKEFKPEKETLSVGDKVTLRIIVTADRDMDFVQIRAQRPACFEPVTQISGYRWMNGRGGYVSMHDASTDIFFDRFTKGTTTYDIEFNVDRAGEYLTGISTAQCAYAPEYTAHSRASRIIVK